MEKFDKNYIISFANMLKRKYNTNDPIKIAEERKIIVWPNDAFVNFIIKANTYKDREGRRIIAINPSYDNLSRKVLCAHELGHALFDGNCGSKLEYGDKRLSHEYVANLFAVALLFSPDEFNIPLTEMSNYTLKTILDMNIKDPTKR